MKKFEVTKSFPLKVGDKVLWADKCTPIGEERVWEVFDVREDMVKIAIGEPTDEGYSEAEVPWNEIIKLEDKTMKKKIRKTMLSAFVGGEWHEFVYTNENLHDVLFFYGMNDVTKFINCWDYSYHPINVTLPDGRELRLMQSVVMCDYLWGKNRIGFEEFLADAIAMRKQRDAMPYLYFMEREGSIYYKQTDTSMNDALRHFYWQREHILIKRGYTQVDGSKNNDGTRWELWHHDDYGDVKLSITMSENPTYIPMKPQKVYSIDHLKDILNDRLNEREGESVDFFILLKGGLRSSKSISWDGESKFYVFNHSDDTEQELTEAQLNDEAYTNIGKAISCGALFMED